MPSKLVIDTDCGVDDAIALIAALSSDCEVVAITCVAGNTVLKNVLANVSKVLRVCNRESIPFYAGCETPIARDHVSAEHFHGADGLGNCPAEFSEGPQPQQDIHAAQALINISREARKQLTLVILGPCTNLAVAHHLDPNVTSYFKEIICMGGNVEGKGNITPGAEFNFACDPEAAHVLIQQSKCPVTLVPWETILNNHITWDLYKQFTGAESLKSRFLKAICKHSEQYYNTEDIGHKGYELGDFLAVLAAIRPESVKEKIDRRLAVELHGEYTSGQVVQAWHKTMLPKVKKLTTIVTHFDPDVVRAVLLSMVDAEKNN